MTNEFVHLHVHSDYSMLDGACRVSDLADMANAAGMPAVACTDHGNMCAAIDFYKNMRQQNIKPIIGCEFYVAPQSRSERNPRDPHTQGYHLILLAEDMEGYRNLCRLNTVAWLEGFYYKPRIDKQILAQHSKGLIALSACIAGEVAAHILEGNEKLVSSSLREYLDIFGRQRFFLELQDHGLPEQATVNRRLVELSVEYGVPLVATNDVHYARKEHAPAHDVLLCIGTQSTVKDPNRMRFTGAEFYFKSPAEMYALFAEHPEALRNTVRIAEQCNLALELGGGSRSHYPVYTVPEGVTRDEYLRQVCLRGLRERYDVDAGAPDLGQDAREMVERMDYELQVIAKTGFTSYFLVVWDFLRHAREQGIPVGPGRGSGAGSLVAYLTRITDIDPLRYGLLFERFLNPDRISPPDFDIDLCERRRYEVIEYVRNKYGAANVAQIGTFGTLKAKAVIKDVARTLGHPFAESNRVTKAVPADPKIDLETALAQSKELQELVEKEAWVREILDYSRVLEGLNRNMSIHAAGVIIGDQALTNLVPLGRGANDEVITQYPAGPCEDLGLLKMDFLGLRTLTIIQDALDLIAQHRGVRLKSADIPLDDAATFALLNKGNTVAVFQLESGGFRDLCRRFGVDRIEDIIALIALYRPGPMEFLDDFIARKTGQTRIEYDLPAMEPILRETYGIMLYQEQVMQVVQKVAGFSLGRADILRRAMGKKKAEEMADQYGKFVSGCKDNGIEEKTANSIWDKIAKFAGYGFNKSHSAAYAMLSYRTAYLKANYPTEFMAAVLSSELGNSDKLAFLLKECRQMGIEVKPPDVNTSGLGFSVDGSSIRFGMAAIKGVGEATAEAAIRTRESGPFTSLLDFCERVGAALNRRVMESLCKAGALDGFGLRRSQVFAVLDEALARAQQTAADRQVGQRSLFDTGDTDSSTGIGIEPPAIPEWEQRELLRYEKELLGFYISGHPIAEYSDIIETFRLDTLADLARLPEQTPTRIGGIIVNVDVKRSKKDNRPWAIVLLEDLEGTIECLVFADTYEAHTALLTAETPVFIEGTVSSGRDGDGVKLMADRIIPMQDGPEQFVKEVHLRVHQGNTDDRKLRELQMLCDSHRGQTPLVMCLICATGEIAFVQPTSTLVRNSHDFRRGVRNCLGEECLLEKPDRTRRTAPGKAGRVAFRRAPAFAEQASE